LWEKAIVSGQQKTRIPPWFLGGFRCQASQVYLQLGEQERAMQVGLEALLVFFAAAWYHYPLVN